MNAVKQIAKLVGCVSVAVGFLSLILVNFRCLYMLNLLTVSAWSMLIGGTALFVGERAKSAIVLALAGLIMVLVSGQKEFFGFLWGYTLLLCCGVIFYFIKTNLGRLAIASAVKLFLGQMLYVILTAALPKGGFLLVIVSAFIAVFLLILAACFLALQFSPIEEAVLKYNQKYIDKKKMLFGKVLSAFRSSRRFCTFYAYSTFVIGVICAVVLFFWASPVKGVKEWNPVLIKKAITQVVGCAIWGCFILSQISCAMKLQGRRIAERTAPVYLLVANFLCWLLVLCAVIGTVHMLLGDIKQGTEMTIDMSYLTMNLVISLDAVGLVGISTHCNPKIALTLSSIVAIWHLIGSNFVALLIRDNIAKVRSLELNKTEE